MNKCNKQCTRLLAHSQFRSEWEREWVRENDSRTFITIHKKLINLLNVKDTLVARQMPGIIASFLVFFGTVRCNLRHIFYSQVPVNNRSTTFEWTKKDHMQLNQPRLRLMMVVSLLLLLFDYIWLLFLYDLSWTTNSSFMPFNFWLFSLHSTSNLINGIFLFYPSRLKIWFTFFVGVVVVW